MSKTRSIHIPPDDAPPYQIVAHRGAASECPENTIPAFLRAAEMGADCVELDVRLTRDQVPVVYHNTYLHETTTLAGPIFEHTLDEVQKAQLLNKSGHPTSDFRIPTLREVLEAVGSKISYEIEIKGPEPEAPAIIANVLTDFQPLWGRIELTSFEPALLLDVQGRCPGIPTDLLYPRSPTWMQRDAAAYDALHRARLANARAVHLHASQLSTKVVETIRQAGIEIHLWDANDSTAFKLAAELNIPKICTDNLRSALSFRKRLKAIPI